MKNFKRDKNDRSKGKHVDIPREERRKVVLCEENGMPSDVKRKERRDDHESTHGKIYIEKSSVDELNTKVIETTCQIEQVFVHKKDIGKEKYFGLVQDETYDKKSNKVQDYISLYYKTDDVVLKDIELQAWWKEIREVGHGDKSCETWWPKMQTREELIHSLTIIIWMSSALHAAINFGQYPYGGFSPNRPGMSRRLIPDPGTAEYEELKTNPVKGYSKTISPQFQTLIGIAVLEVLSIHSSDEFFLGQREAAEWTKDKEALKTFEKFGKKVAEIEEKITMMNNDEKLKNRTGPVKMPYTLLLYPTSEPGLVTANGIPNSISI
ncbi:hypothetical protein FXO38_14386 [Capsicum annuum]|nr:hypothetical protein FXO37_23411 [Capsicum annuum]KAF3656046.1 hypothetical protein FXO38_14386 [Capsicum annuum]